MIYVVGLDQPCQHRRDHLIFVEGLQTCIPKNWTLSLDVVPPTHKGLGRLFWDGTMSRVVCLRNPVLEPLHFWLVLTIGSQLTSSQAWHNHTSSSAVKFASLVCGKPFLLLALVLITVGHHWNWCLLRGHAQSCSMWVSSTNYHTVPGGRSNSKPV
jgi:hypothetical protein